MTDPEIQGSEGGRPVLFLHGAGANRAMWIPEVEILSERFKTIAFDLPGHGVRRDERFRLDDSAAAAAAVIEEHAGGQALVVGLSLGGYVAITLASEHPQLVAGLVLSGSSIDYRGWDGLSTKLYGFLVPLIAKRLQSKADGALRDIAGEDVAQQIIGRGMSLTAAAQALKSIPGNDYPALLSQYPGPTLILNGERDKPNVEQAPAMAEAAQNARIVTLANCGHACSLSQPKAFSAAVEDFASELAWEPAPS